jgi:class 3 adenylate cyclase
MPYCADHAVQMVLAALEMLSALDEYNEMCGGTFRARVGIHSGDLVGGVLGNAHVSVSAVCLLSHVHTTFIHSCILTSGATQ